MKFVEDAVFSGVGSEPPRLFQQTVPNHIFLLQIQSIKKSTSINLTCIESLFSPYTVSTIIKEWIL